MEIARFVTRTGIILIFCQFDNIYAIRSFCHGDEDIAIYENFGEALLEFNELCQ